MGSPGYPAAVKLLELLEISHLTTPEEFLKCRDEALLTLFPEAQLLPGAERLIRHLHAHKVPIAIASGSNTNFFALKTAKHEALFALFMHKTLGDDPELRNGKPHPDAFLLCHSRFPKPLPDPQSVLVFEDAPNGVTAARAANMHVVAVPDQRARPEQFSHASLVLSSLEEFRPELWGLPAL